MSFNHAICDDCWGKREPKRDPVRIKDFKCMSCCFCGDPTVSGIYVRNDPKDEKLACKGEHKED